MYIQNDDDGSIQNGVEFPDGVITDGRISCKYVAILCVLNIMCY